MDQTVLQGDRLEARAAGSFDISGRLDLGATLLLPRDLAERAGSLSRELVAAAGADGRVPVGLRITGNVERPDVALDLSAARTAVVDRAREAAEEQARELAGRATREAVERLELPDSLRGLPADSLRTLLGDSLFTLLPDSVKLPADSLQERAEDALQERLRKLLRGGGGGSR
ncbi:MAG: hypothetical protein GWM90_22770 [Gemmatimonadetes bacterium]|nr:hypothetical protein [Gemmatimonadota bacterium]NIQ57452.1 hypothetical protein [Gemmatimonadota bacterium]NIU77616.1 hypothetical protein [Gammaproteobacteria bacterium]NIX46798.1 hypothetical protein [Gemmatimonadota bacterium]NIY11155.1 hypothetical protein [Gemmatimonadota bacterium]